MLKKWEELPAQFHNEEVRKYYRILERKKYSLAIKRVFDVVLATLMTIVLSPVMLILAVLIKREDGGSVFYRQERITTYGKSFRIFKFRTMVEHADRHGPLVTGKSDSRITKIGEKLRKCRLDELPQLLNIITGDMSFVGTRPEVQKYVGAYSGEMLATLLLPAGVTSPASIAYKDEDEIMARYTEAGESTDDAYIQHVLPEKMKYNLKYLRTFSVLNDWKIMIQTVVAVLK